MTAHTMQMLVIAPWGQDTGFRLGGVPVAIATDAPSLNAELERAIGGGAAGVIAMPEGMREWISTKTLRALRETPFPLLVFYNLAGEWETDEEAAEEAAGIIQRAIGFRLKIKL